MKKTFTKKYLPGHQLIAGLRREHLFVLVVIAAMCFFLWGFIELAEEVMEGDLQQVDRELLLSLRSSGDKADPIGPRWFEEMMRDATGLGGVGVLTFITAMSTGYLLLEHKWRLAIMVVGAIGSGILVSFLLKSGFDRPRPDLVAHGSYVYTSSFPSGHSMMSALVYLTLAGLLSQIQQRKRVKFYLFCTAAILTGSIGFSRVYLGVHWPTDVLAGWAAGAFWAVLAYIVGMVLRFRGYLDQPGTAPELRE